MTRACDINGGRLWTADLRARSAEALNRATRGLADAARAERVEAQVAEFWRSPPTPFSPAVIEAVAAAAGTSHNEREWTDPGDCARGAAALLDAVRQLAGPA